MRSEFLIRTFVVGSMLAIAPDMAAAASHTIDVGISAAGAPANAFIDPTSSTSVTNATVGDTVTFMNVGAAPGFHNVRSDGPTTTFRCADGCDGVGNGSGDPAATNWSATITLTTPDTIDYYCEIHGSPGQAMHGTINVTTPVELQSFGVD